MGEAEGSPSDVGRASRKVCMPEEGHCRTWHVHQHSIQPFVQDQESRFNTFCSSDVSLTEMRTLLSLLSMQTRLLYRHQPLTACQRQLLPFSRMQTGICLHTLRVCKPYQQAPPHPAFCQCSCKALSEIQTTNHCWISSGRSPCLMPNMLLTLGSTSSILQARGDKQP